MAFPAWRAWRDANRDVCVYILAKRSVAGLWNYVKDLDGVIVLEPGRAGMRKAAEELRTFGADEALILPQSFRSAALMKRGRVKRCRGTTGQFRFFFINDPISIKDLAAEHQQLEYARLLGVEGDLPSPALAIDTTRLPLFDAEGIERALIVLPGAARGSSKRWRADYFAEVALSALKDGLVERIYVCGTPGEATECDAVTKAISAKSDDVVNLCGRTKLGELAYLMSKCRAALSNDSGGMHLATAMGAPVVAVFGITDSSKTGPLGKSRVVAAEGVKVSRAIPRESEIATRALDSVKPERVYAALRELLANG